MCVIQYVFDISFWDCDFFCVVDCGFQLIVFFWINCIFGVVVLIMDCGENVIQFGFVYFGIGYDGCDFLFFFDFLVDEFFDIRVVCIIDYYFGCVMGCVVGFNCICCMVIDFQEVYQV